MTITVRHYTIIAAMTFCFMAAFSSCVKEDDGPDKGLGVGDSLPRFSVVLSDGETISEASLAGKVAVIEFFNTSCPDCRRSFPVLQELYDIFKDDYKVRIVAIAREESDDEIKRYWHANGLTIPYSPQADRTVYNLFASVGIPRIFVVTPTGTISATYGPENIPDLSALVADMEHAAGNNL